MDPLNNFSGSLILGYIFQHLTAEEIIESTLVSRGWNSEIGDSREAMEKVWLNVGDRQNEPSKEDLRAFRSSERKYQNFKISEIENGLQILLFPKRRWRRAQIDIQSFTSFKDFVNLLKIFDESIIELDIFDMDVEYVDGDAECLQFPFLEKLRLGFVKSTTLKPFLLHQPKLKKIQLESISDHGMKESESSTELIVKLLSLQTNLTHLSLSADSFANFFKKSGIFEFSLNHLIVEQNRNCEGDETSNILLNFQYFIKQQKKLQRITLCEWTCSESLKIILNHESIERISFDYFDEESKKFDFTLTNFGVNRKVKQLDFEVENCSLSWLEPILKACPFVETLYFFHVDEKLLNFLISNFKFLTKLDYCSIFQDFPLREKNFNFAVTETKFLNFKKLF